MKHMIAALVALALTLSACGQSTSSGNTTAPQGQPTADLENPPVGAPGGPGINTEDLQATPAPPAAAGSTGGVDNSGTTTGDNGAGNTRLPGETGTDQQPHSNPLDANPAPGNDPVAGAGNYPAGRSNVGDAATGTGPNPTASSSTDPISGTDLDSARNVVDMAAGDGRFTILIAALRSTGLDRELAQGGPYTLFAPTDDAFRALPVATRDQLQRDPAALRALLLSHVAEGAVYAPYNAEPSEAMVGGGQELVMRVENGEVLIGDEATVINPNIPAANGVLHVVDRVLGIPNSAVATSR
jgi:uncharacterized surface protein with fasciclin (FAS1) repeats